MKRGRERAGGVATTPRPPLPSTLVVQAQRPSLAVPLPHNIRLINGDYAEVVGSLDLNSIDRCITDPPYELGFLGKPWDKAAIRRHLQRRANLKWHWNLRACENVVKKPVCSLKERDTPAGWSGGPANLGDRSRKVSRRLIAHGPGRIA